MTQVNAIRLNKALRKALHVTGVLEHQDIVKYVRVMQSLAKLKTKEEYDVLHSKKQKAQ